MAQEMARDPPIEDPAPHEMNSASGERRPQPLPWVAKQDPQEVHPPSSGSLAAKAPSPSPLGLRVTRSTVSPTGQPDLGLSPARDSQG